MNDDTILSKDDTQKLLASKVSRDGGTFKKNHGF